MKFVQTSSNSQSVCRELRKILRSLASQWAKVLRIDVVIAPTTTNSVYRLSRIRTWNEFLLLTMIHWYLPEDAFSLVHLELQDLYSKFGTDKDIIAQIILSSEPEMIIYFLESSECFKDERQLFGFVQRNIQLEKYHFYIQKPRRPKQRVYRRGYNDQGSRRLPHEIHESKYDYSFTEEQNRIEEERQARKDTADFAKGFIG